MAVSEKGAERRLDVSDSYSSTCLIVTLTGITLGLSVRELANCEYHMQENVNLECVTDELLVFGLDHRGQLL